MRALIVDDVLAMRYFLSMCLSDIDGIEIDQAADGMEAAAKLSRETYGLVLLDLNLPLMDGLAVLRLLRSMPEPHKDSKVIVISTNASTETIAKVSRFGATFLPKPVRASEVRDMARSILKLPTPALPPGAERRGAARLKMEVEARFEGREVRNLVTADINALGAFLPTEKPEPLGSHGVVTLSFAHLSSPIRVECTVVHIRPPGLAHTTAGFGVRFEPADPEVGLRLSRAFSSEGLDSR